MMVLFGGVLGVLMFGLWLFCMFDVITTPPTAVRNLPKLVWVLIVIIGFDLGSIAWLFAGRPWGPKTAGAPRRLGFGPADPGADSDSGGFGGFGSRGGFGGSADRPAFGGLFGGARPAESSFGPPPRSRKPARPMNPDDDDEFLASLSAKAEEQRRRAREADGDRPGDGPEATGT